jgi:hypothetical protein
MHCADDYGLAIISIIRLIADIAFIDCRLKFLGYAVAPWHIFINFITIEYIKDMIYGKSYSIFIIFLKHMNYLA